MSDGIARPRNEGIVQLDILRIAAAAAVVWLHVSAGVVLNPDDTLRQWWQGNIADAASRWCIPVFVMISGALLLGERRPSTPREFYARRAARLLAPLIFWTVLYLAYRRFTAHTGLAELFKDTVKGGPYFHLWFLYMIVGLYAATPLLRILVANSSRTTITTTAAIIFCIACVEATLGYVTAHRTGQETPHTFLILWLPFTAYFLAGYILREWPCRVSIAAALTCIVLSCAFLAILTAYVRFRMGWQDAYFTYDAFNPIVILHVRHSVRLRFQRPAFVFARHARPASIASWPHA